MGEDAAESQVLARAIKQVQWQHHRALDSRLRRVGSTIVQWDVLRAIELRPSASGHDLAMATYQSDQTFGVTIRRMIANGLVERSTPKGRRFEYWITESGREVLDVGDQAAAAIFTAAFAPLDPAERGVLLNLLRRVSAASPPGIPTSPGIPLPPRGPLAADLPVGGESRGKGDG
jgi:DNA-binding MarR family transcriptional regulator